MHGVIDSPDIPLNVSRSYLQGDQNVKRISSHITKKVADKLEEIFKNDRTQFEEKWESLGLFVKYGMMTDDKFLDKANKFHILQDASDNKFYTIEEYRRKKEKNRFSGEIFYLNIYGRIQEYTRLRIRAKKKKK